MRSSLLQKGGDTRVLWKRMLQKSRQTPKLAQMAWRLPHIQQTMTFSTQPMPAQQLDPKRRQQQQPKWTNPQNIPGLVKPAASTSLHQEVTEPKTPSSNEHDNVKSSSTVPQAFVSTDTLTYTGGISMPITSKLHIVTPQEDAPQGTWPVFRLMVCTRTENDPSNFYQSS